MTKRRGHTGGDGTLTASRSISFLLLASLCLCVAFQVTGLVLHYSYWENELFSVSVAQLAFREQISMLLQDVHPPLYQMLLAAWVSIFGASELATRLLSITCFVAALAAYGSYRTTLGPARATLFYVLMISNWLVVFYAQEVRSYALLFALSVWAVALYIRQDRSGWFYAVVIAMGLTHFFGTLLAGFLLLWRMAEALKTRGSVVPMVLSGGALLIWPVLYVLFGSARELSGGSFWIETTPLDAIPHALEATVPLVIELKEVVDRLSGPGLATLVLAASALGLLMLAALVLRQVSPDERVILAKCLYLITGTVLTAALISIHTPIVTTRNFIVLIPAASLIATFVFSDLLTRLAGHKIALGVLVIFVVANQAIIVSKLDARFAPREDWKHVAATMLSENDMSAVETVYVYASEAADRDPDFLLKQLCFYMPDVDNVELLTAEDISGISGNSLIYFGHIPGRKTASNMCANEISDALDTLGVPYSSYYAPQGWMCDNGYYAIGDL